MPARTHPCQLTPRRCAGLPVSFSTRRPSAMVRAGRTYMQHAQQGCHQGWAVHAAPWTAAPTSPRVCHQGLGHAAKPCTCLACSSCRPRARAGPKLGCFVLEPADAGCLRHGRWVGQDLLWRIGGLFNLGCCRVCNLERLRKVKRDRCAHLCQAASICRVQHRCMIAHISQHPDNRNLASTACMAATKPCPSPTHR